jgi:hypothetical protein
MKVEGFAIARNVIKADYPIKEALESIAPLCSRISIAVGQSDDNTRSYLEGLSHLPLHLVDTQWDDSLREGGKVLAVETDKAKALVSADADWLIYIQADECLHESDYPIIQAAMEHYKDDEGVDALLLQYKHFYGSYHYVGDSRRWYRKEIRIIKNKAEIFSWRDAQGFRKRPAEKLRVAEIPAQVYHYGWVKHPEQQQIKQRQFHRLWHSDEAVNKRVGEASSFDYNQIDSLKPYKGSHPECMSGRIQTMNWQFTPNLSRKNMSVKARFLYAIESCCGWRVGEYRNYITVSQFDKLTR